MKNWNYALCAAIALSSAAIARADTLVTFQVDMSQQITLGNFTPGVNVVNARGTFNGWGTYQLTNNPSGANPNLYSGTVDDTSDANGSTLNYKYCIDSGGWENPATCNNNNRQLGLPAASGASLTLPLVWFSDTEPAASVSDTVTFQVDMTEAIAVGSFIPGTSTVSLRGDMNGWTTTTLSNNPSGPTPNIYTNVVAITAAPQHLGHYKFFIDTGSNWENPAGTNQDCSGNRFWTMSSAGSTYALPAHFFNDVGVAPPATNTVNFQVDMSVQATIGHFNFNNGDTVECRGSFNGWTGGAFVLTNNPNAANSNLFSGTAVIVAPPNTMQYKFWNSDPQAGNTGWENPASTFGNNRAANLRATNSNYSLAAVYFNDTHSDSDFVLADTLVFFSVTMTNANGYVIGNGTDNHQFNPVTDQVYLNGDFLGLLSWWGWGSASPPPQFQMTNNPVGSATYTLGVTVPKGNLLQLTYKFSINGNDDEAPGGDNHVRWIRALANYTLPPDTFGAQGNSTLSEPNFGLLSAAQGTAGHTAISWLGRPGVHLQTKTSLPSGSWTDLFNTDGTNWSNYSFISTNGPISTTNWPSASGNRYFRLINP